MSLKFLNPSPVPYEKREMLYRVWRSISEVRLISCVLSLLWLLDFIEAHSSRNVTRERERELWFEVTLQWSGNR